MRCGDCAHLNPIPGRESCTPHGLRSPAQEACEGMFFTAGPVRAWLDEKILKRPPQGDLF